MTLTPRFIPGQPLTPASLEAEWQVQGDGWSYNTDQVPDASRITPYQDPRPADEQHVINPIRISADINAGQPLADITSAWHDIRVSREQQRYQLELANGPVSMSRDFELRWRPEPGREPTAAVFNETVGGEHYALLMLLPPTQVDQDKVLPRDMIFVIDTSGSMGGVSIRQARASLLQALDQLRPVDRFNVIAFNDSPMLLFNDSQSASHANISQARQFVRQLQAGGGTQMRPALESALNAPADESYLRQVLFITDGAVGNETALFELIHQKLGTARLFTVGIGSAPNSYFMRKAAQFGRGTFTYIGSVNEVTDRMQQLFRKIDAPVAGDLQVTWPDGQAESYPDPIPDLYQGEALLLSSRLQQPAGSVTVRGRTAGQTWRRQLTLTANTDSAGVASVWARRKIAQLLDARAAGRDESAVREDVLPVALAHRLVSPYTSFVAVEKTPSRPADTSLEKENVLNARPQGQSAQPYAWPATATDSRFNMLLGMLLLLLAFVNWWQNRRPRHG